MVDPVRITGLHTIAVFKPRLKNIVIQYIFTGNRVLVTGKLTYLHMKDDSGKDIGKRASIVAHEVIRLNANSDT